MGTTNVLLLQTPHLHWSAVETALKDIPGVRVSVERAQAGDIVGLCDRHGPDLIIAAATIEQESALPALAEVRRRRGAEVRFVFIDWSLDDHNRVREVLSLDPVGYFVWTELDAFALPVFLEAIVRYGATALGPAAMRLRLEAHIGHLSVIGEPPALTNRQLNMLRMLSAGLARKQVGRQLAISQETLARDVRALRESFDAATDLEMMSKATISGLVP